MREGRLPLLLRPSAEGLAVGRRWRAKWRQAGMPQPCCPRCSAEYYSVDVRVPCGADGAAIPPGQGQRVAPRRVGQQLVRIITVRTGDAGDGWLCPMSSYPHDLYSAWTFPSPAAGLTIRVTYGSSRVARRAS